MENNTNQQTVQQDTTLNKSIELNMDYVLFRIDKIINDTEYIKNALTTLTSFEIIDGCGDVANQAKAMAISQIVECRETTNQQILKLLEKMYDDLKNQQS